MRWGWLVFGGGALAGCDPDSTDRQGIQIGQESGCGYESESIEVDASGPEGVAAVDLFPAGGFATAPLLDTAGTPIATVTLEGAPQRASLLASEGEGCPSEVLQVEASFTWTTDDGRFDETFEAVFTVTKREAFVESAFPLDDGTRMTLAFTLDDAGTHDGRASVDGELVGTWSTR